MIKFQVRLFLALVFLGLFLSACSRSPVGTYMVDSRPSEMVFLTITQAQDVLSGSLMRVAPDGHGGTRMETISLSGNGASGGFALTANAGGFLGLIGAKVQLTGRMEGRQIVLNVPTSTGIFSTVKFSPTNEAEFNQAMIEWRKKIAAEFAISQRRAAEEKAVADQKNEEERTFIALATAVRNDIQNISQTGIPKEMNDAKSALDKMAKDVGFIEHDLLGLKADAAVLPMTCYQAEQKVRYDFEQKMRYHWEQSLGYNRKMFHDAIDRLEKRLEVGKAMDVKIVLDGNNFAQFLKNARYSESARRVEPGAERSALEQYRALMSSATTQIPSWKAGAEAHVESAKKLMQEGQAITKDALQRASCH
jgi:hypothetical protein